MNCLTKHSNQAPSFIYDVSIYKVYKRGAFLIDTQLYTSNKKLNITKPTTIKRFRNYSIVRYIDLVKELNN